MKRCFTILACLFVAFSQAQIERDGTPLSWLASFGSANGTVWQSLPSLDIETLLAEDAAESDNKSIPLRFAKRVPVQINFENSGRWVNLHNGDRLWLCGVEMDQAFSMGFSFTNLQIPEGGSFYFYTSDKSDFIGPLTRRHNSSDQPFIVPPIAGHRIILEYYEPNAFRGMGHMTIDAVNGSYRDFKDEMLLADVPCWNPLTFNVNNSAQVNASSSVLLAIVDEGQRLGTSVLLNNTSSNGVPYLMTSSSMLMGQPSRWLFLFDVVGSGCFNTSINCWNKAVCGGVVNEINQEAGLALIRLKEMPRQHWSAYYSGWKTTEMTDSQLFFLIQQAKGYPQSLAEFNGELEMTLWNGIEVAAIQSWDDGGTFRGSIGSPLFDQDLNLVGIQIGGELNCEGEGKDYFAMLSTTWDSFKEYLDPFVTGQDRFNGDFPIVEDTGSNQEQEAFAVFPNPAKDWLYVRNMTNEPVEYIEIADGAGRVVDSFRPLTPSLDIAHLPDGIYFMWIVTASHRVAHRVLVR